MDYRRKKGETTMKKYKLLEREDNGLCRIQALKDFSDVKKGDIGGYVESENNLSQYGNCWVSDNARVFDNALVFDNAKISCSARVSDNAKISGSASVYGGAGVYGDAMVFNNARVSDNAKISGSAMVSGNARVSDNAEVCGYARVFNNARVSDNAKISGSASVFNNARVSDNAEVCGYAKMTGSAIAAKKNVINIIGLPYNITLTDNHIQIGCYQFTVEEALELAKDWATTKSKFSEAHELQPYKSVIVAHIKQRLKEKIK
jgi:UDP-3-O-[3-hydroxymyristoyl] glucosamine N-acyltransferase